jgi:hypothetical protein
VAQNVKYLLKPDFSDPEKLIKQVLEMYRKLHGRDPTPEDFAEAERRIREWLRSSEGSKTPGEPSDASEKSPED